MELKIFFPKAPLSCISGEEKEGPRLQVCKEIAQRKAQQGGKEAPIEFIAYQIYIALKKELPVYVDLQVRVRKGGVSFLYLVPKESPELPPRHPPHRWDDV